MGETERTPLARLAADARLLANRAFGEESPACRDAAHGPRCMDKPRRPKPGESYVPFRDYDTSKMCQPCEAYWHAEMAAQAFEQLAHWDRRTAAEKARAS